MGGEYFKADPRDIAGMGKLVTEVAGDSKKIAEFIGQNATPSEFFSGPIIGDLMEPFRIAAEATRARMHDIGVHNLSTGGELNKAAWIYHNQDEKNYAALNAHTHTLFGETPRAYGQDEEMPGYTDAYLDPIEYPKPESFELGAPAANKEDLAALITEVAGWLGDVNESIKSVTRTAGNEVDPLGWVLRPIEGNWNELKRIGESYKIAGNAMEASGKNLEAGYRKVDEHWNGKAAQSFQDWANRQIAAMKWEGPVGRVANDALAVVADKIREGIKTGVLKLKEMLEEYIVVKDLKGVFKQVIKKVPGLGMVAEAIDLGYKIYKIVTAVRDIVRQIEELKNRLKEFLQAISDPVGTATTKAHQKLEEKLAPITNRVNDATRKAAIAKDLTEIAQFENTTHRPKESYEVGAGNQPWENA